MSDQGELGQNSIGLLNPMIVKASQRDIHLPGSENVSRNEDLVMDGDTLVFKRIFHLEEAQPIFLTWKESFSGKTIRNAYFTPLRTNIMNKDFSTYERKPAFFDQDQRRWYVPVLELLERELKDVDPGEIYWAMLELHGSDGEILKFRVGLRVAGVVPLVKVEKISGNSIRLSSENTGRFVHKNGWNPLIEQVTNPSGRRLALWLRVRGGGTLQTTISAPQFQNVAPREKFPAMGIGGWDHLGAVLPMEITELIVERNRESSTDTESRSHDEKSADETTRTSYAVEENQWIKISLEPFEKLRLAWKSQLANEPKKCPLPKDRARHWAWEHKYICGGGPDGVDYCREGKTTINLEKWSVTRALVTGEFSRDLVIADRAVSLNKLLEELVHHSSQVSSPESSPVSTKDAPAVEEQILAGFKTQPEHPFRFNLRVLESNDLNRNPFSIGKHPPAEKVSRYSCQGIF